MVRPCFLVIDREFAGSISTRKLVIETAKFNVITAYSCGEALATVERFPAVDGVVLDAGVRDLPADDVVNQFKQRHPDLPVIVIRAVGAADCPAADFHLNFFDPVKLLGLLQNLKPREAAAIEAHDQALAKQQIIEDVSDPMDEA
ncbi:MAG TPA: response regulator [Acidobacteriaceae bacterium]|nr:response regulator [Acidobacteriaceae bacterium]